MLVIAGTAILILGIMAFNSYLRQEPGWMGEIGLCLFLIFTLSVVALG